MRTEATNIIPGFLIYSNENGWVKHTLTQTGHYTFCLLLFWSWWILQIKICKQFNANPFLFTNDESNKNNQK